MRFVDKASLVQHEKKSPHEGRLGAAQEKQFRWALDPKTGYYFFGKHYLNEADKSADIQLRTKWIALGGIPLIPLASYRLKCKQKSFRWFRWNEEQQVVNRVALNWNQILLTWIKTFLSMAVVIPAFALYDWLKGRR